MPVFNGEKFLSEAIESILNQTYKNFEFLIVYDESSDNTLSIIQNYRVQDPRIILIYGDNEGISGALNKGIQKANGDYIARLDSDDLSLPGRFRTQIEYMRMHNLDICGGHSVLIDCDGKVNGIGMVPRSHDLCALSMLFMVPFAHSSVMISKNFLIKNSLKYKGNYEDFDLWIRMYSKGARFGNVDDIVIYYRVLEESLSTIHETISRRDTRRVIKTFRQRYGKYLSGVLGDINLSLLSEAEKSLVARYLINNALTKFDLFGLKKLKGIKLKNIIITGLSEIYRIMTKYSWWKIF